MCGVTLPPPHTTQSLRDFFSATSFLPDLKYLVCFAYFTLLNINSSVKYKNKK